MEQQVDEAVAGGPLLVQRVIERVRAEQQRPEHRARALAGKGARIGEKLRNIGQRAQVPIVLYRVPVVEMEWIVERIGEESQAYKGEDQHRSNDRLIH